MPSADTAARAAGRRSGARLASSTRHPPRRGDAADQALTHRQHLVGLAQPIGEPALAAEQQRLAVDRHEMEARDLVPGHVGERAQRLLDDLVEVERPAHRVGDRPENLQMADERGGAAHASIVDSRH